MFIIRLAAEALALTGERFMCSEDTGLSDIKLHESVTGIDAEFSEELPLEYHCPLSGQKQCVRKDLSVEDASSTPVGQPKQSRKKPVAYYSHSDPTYTGSNLEDNKSILFSILSGREDVHTARSRSELYLFTLRHSAWYSSTTLRYGEKKPLYSPRSRKVRSLRSTNASRKYDSCKNLRPENPYASAVNEDLLKRQIADESSKILHRDTASKRTHDSVPDMDKDFLLTPKRNFCNLDEPRERTIDDPLGQGLDELYKSDLTNIQTDQPLDLSPLSSNRQLVIQGYAERNKTDTNHPNSNTSLQRAKNLQVYLDNVSSKSLEGFQDNPESNEAVPVSIVPHIRQLAEFETQYPSSNGPTCRQAFTNSHPDLAPAFSQRFNEFVSFPFSIAAALSVVAALRSQTHLKSDKQSTTPSLVFPPMGSDPFITSRLLQFVKEHVSGDEAFAQLKPRYGKHPNQLPHPVILQPMNGKNAADCTWRPSFGHNITLNQSPRTPILISEGAEDTVKRMTTCSSFAEPSKSNIHVYPESKRVAAKEMLFSKSHQSCADGKYYASSSDGNPSVTKGLDDPQRRDIMCHTDTRFVDKTISNGHKSYITAQPQLLIECSNHLPNPRSVAHSLLMRLIRLIKWPEQILLKCLDHLSHSSLSEESLTATNQHSFVRHLSSVLLNLMQCSLEDRISYSKANWHHVLAVCGEDSLSKLMLLFKDKVAKLTTRGQSTRRNEGALLLSEIQCQEAQLIRRQTREFCRTLRQLEMLHVALDCVQMNYPTCLLVCVTLLSHGSHSQTVEQENTRLMENCIINYLNTRYTVTSNEYGHIISNQRRAAILSKAVGILQNLNRETMRAVFFGVLPEPFELMLEKFASVG